MTIPKVAAIILAAGKATRFGQPKQTINWLDQPLIVHAVDTAWNANLSPIITVVGAHADTIVPLLEGRSVQIQRNYRWAQGMSTSLNIGLAALPADVEAVIFLPVDQPLVTPPMLQSLVARWQETHAGIVAPQTPHGQRGSPALFSRNFFAELAQLSGDVGGRVLFDKHADQLAYVSVAAPQILDDIDTPDDLLRLRAAVKQTSVRPNFGQIRGIICDMDGVLWRGGTPLPGLHEFFTLIQELQLGYVFVTNNSSKTPQMHVDKLASVGVHTTTDHVLTSSLAAADYLGGIAAPGTSVYPMGGPGLMQALTSRGFRLSDGEAAEYVAVGWDQALTWNKLAIATRLIRAGATFIGTNPDRTFPTENTLAPGNGAQLAALEAATNIAPLIAGKPSAILYEQAQARMGTTAKATLVIGDRLDTDILGGTRLGMPTVMLLSGVTPPEALHTSPIRPDRVFDHLLALATAWRQGLKTK